MEYKRNCPKCGKDLYYTSKYNRNALEKKGTLCMSCSSVIKNKKHGNNKKFIERYGTKGNNIGKDNAFYGKHHTEETKEKILKDRDYSYAKTKDFRKKQSINNSGIKNPMYGKTYYDIWISKYGKIEADKRQKEKIKKNSIASSGKNNPMYGKPTPQGAGNGWSGWYKGWFFRSLRELSYMVKEIERKNKKWRTAETKDLKIKYVDYKGSERTYVADFLVEEKDLIEVKPKKLKKSLTVRLKAKAARKFCKEKGLTYKIKDVKTLSEKEIKELHDKKIIKFTDRYEKKYNERLQNISK